MKKSGMLIAVVAVVALAILWRARSAVAGAAVSPQCSGKSGDGMGYWTDVL